MKKKKAKPAVRVIQIKYEMDTTCLDKAIKKANELRVIMRSIAFK